MIQSFLVILCDIKLAFVEFETLSAISEGKAIGKSCSKFQLTKRQKSFEKRTTFTMELIGDSNLVSQEPSNNLEADKIELSSGDFKEKLANQEKRLVELETKRVEINEELEEMLCDIEKEKLKLRQAIDGIIVERDKISHEIAAFELNFQQDEESKNFGVSFNDHVEEIGDNVGSVELDVDEVRSEEIEMEKS